MRTELPCFGIVIECDRDIRGAAIVASGLKERCPHCGQPECNFSCDDSQGACGEDCDNEETEYDVADRLTFNGMMDVVESLILAHFAAGIDVTTPAYLEGVETTVLACQNRAT